MKLQYENLQLLNTIERSIPIFHYCIAVVLNLFWLATHFFKNYFFMTHFHAKKSRSTCLCDKFLWSFLKIISENFLAKLWRKFATHKCVATPCLRNTAVLYCKVLNPDADAYYEPQLKYGWPLAVCYNRV